MVEDHTQASHTVSPLMVHVVVHPSIDEVGGLVSGGCHTRILL